MKPEITMQMVVVAHVLMIICPIMIYVLFMKAECIRESKYWFVAVLGYLFCLVQVAGAANVLSIYYNTPTIRDEVGVPVVFGAIAIVTILCIFHVRRSIRRETEEVHEKD